VACEINAQGRCAVYVHQGEFGEHFHLPFWLLMVLLHRASINPISKFIEIAMINGKSQA
jgi:hypothetical protein